MLNVSTAWQVDLLLWSNSLTHPKCNSHFDNTKRQRSISCFLLLSLNQCVCECKSWIHLSTQFGKHNWPPWLTQQMFSVPIKPKGWLLLHPKMFFSNQMMVLRSNFEQFLSTGYYMVLLLSFSSGALGRETWRLTQFLGNPKCDSKLAASLIQLMLYMSYSTSSGNIYLCKSILNIFFLWNRPWHRLTFSLYGHLDPVAQL